MSEPRLIRDYLAELSGQLPASIVEELAVGSLLGSLLKPCGGVSS